MARSFNGTSDLIAADLAASWTERVNYWVACWVNAPQQAGTVSQRAFFSEGRRTVNQTFFLLTNDTVANGKRAVISCRGDSGTGAQINAGTTAAVCDSTWHHFVYTQSVSGATTSWKTYVDGVADVSGSFTNIAATINQLAIGCARRAVNGNFYNGKVFEVAKGLRTLAANEAKLLAAGLPASHLGPDHYWPVWGVDSPEPDLGLLTHRTGTLTGTSFSAGARVSPNLLLTA